MLTWRLVEWIRFRHLTRMGSANGVLAGLVAITPSCAFVNVEGALVVGIIAAIVCMYAVEMKLVAGYDDTLDVTGFHGAGGVTGILLLGFLATGELVGTPGLFYGGSAALLGKQAVGVLVVGVYSFVVTFIIGKVVDGLFRMRANEEEQRAGSDVGFAAG